MSIVTHIVVLIVLPFDSIEKHFSSTSGAGKRLYLQDTADLALCLQPPQIKHSELSPAKSDAFSFFLFGPSTCLEGANTGRSSEGGANTWLAVHSAKGNETWQRFHCPL